MEATLELRIKALEFASNDRYRNDYEGNTEAVVRSAEKYLVFLTGGRKMTKKTKKG